MFLEEISHYFRRTGVFLFSSQCQYYFIVRYAPLMFAINICASGPCTNISELVREKRIQEQPIIPQN